jgi:hypothetical protein
MHGRMFLFDFFNGIDWKRTLVVAMYLAGTAPNLPVDTSVVQWQILEWKSRLRVLPTDSPSAFADVDLRRGIEKQYLAYLPFSLDRPRTGVSEFLRKRG